MPLIYRSIKGSELTSDEVDGNFDFLNTEKQNNLVFDSVPTNGSSNSLTSGAIYTALQDYLEKDGSVQATGDFNWGGNDIRNLGIIQGDLSTGTIFDLNAGYIQDQFGTAIDIANRQLKDTGDGFSIDWDVRTLTDDAATLSIDWQNRIFKDESGADILDYSDISTGVKIGNGTYWASINPSNLTADNNFFLPDKSGGQTFAMLSDLAGDTGVLTYGGASASSATQINIGAVTGWIIDNETIPGTPNRTYINYAGASNVTVTTIGSGLASYVLLDSTGTIVFQNTFPTSAQRKTHIYLSKIGHPAGSITTVGNEPDFITSPIAQLRDLGSSIGFINIGVVPSANGANLNFNTSAGSAYRTNGYFVTDKTTPNIIPVAAQTPASFLYRTQTGAGGGFVTAIDPTNYDLAGTITAIPGSTNQATNQYIYLVPGLGYIVQRGQVIYSTLTDAIEGVGREIFTIYPSLVNNAILIGILSVTKGCTALNNTTTARFFLADKFGQSTGSSAGVSTATLQSSYNNSLVPQITVTDSLTEVIFRNGRASNASNVFAIQNIAGSTTASINGNGVITGSATQLASVSLLDTTYKTALDVSAANTLRLGNGFTNITTPVNLLTLTSGGIILNGGSSASYLILDGVTQRAVLTMGTVAGRLDLAAGGWSNLQISPALITLTNASSTIANVSGSGSIALQTVGGASSPTNGILFTRSASVTNTSGQVNLITLATSGTDIFSPSSGTLNFTGIDWQGKLNQTSTASGVVSLIDLHPTVTSITGTLYGLRSRIAASPTGGGTAWNIYADGTAPNRFIGNIESGTIQLLDTTYKEALAVASAGTLRVGNAFSTIVIPNSLNIGSNLKFTNASAKGIYDANGQVLLNFPASVASATNYIELSNAASTNAPTFTAVGGDTNIGIAFNAKGTGIISFGSPVKFPSYTVAGVPSASNIGATIYVSNESGGAVLAFSDGTNWRRVTDRAIIS